MSGVSLNRPQRLILNSKYRNSNEQVSNVTYNLITPIEGATGARIHNISLIYLIPLINDTQAELNWSLDVSGNSWNYTTDLDGLTNNYYDNLSKLLEDLNSLVQAPFTDASGSGTQFSEDYKPELLFDSETKQIIFQMVTTISEAHVLTIDSNNNNFWFKLGFPNGTYTTTNNVLYSPSYPSIIPLNELYLEIDGLKSVTTLLQTSNTAYHNNPNITDVITFSNTAQGDLFQYFSPTIPEYGLETQNFFQTLRVRLLNSIGQEINLKSDYKLTIEFKYD